MIRFLFACTIALGMVSAQAPQPKVWLMFFMRGEGKAPEGSDQKEMLNGHLGNMRHQVDLGRLVAAGPLADPTKEKRGITVLIAKSEKDIPGFFTNDPFVKAGMMTIQARPWNVDASRFDPKVDPSALSEYRLVIVKRGKGMQPQTAAMGKQHEDCLTALAKQFGPGVYGDLEGIGTAMILTTKDTEGILSLLKTDPLVAKAILAVDIIPLFMSKGIVKP